MTSPLLALPGAVAGDGLDAPVAAHYGSFNAEQRTLTSGEGFVDLSHRDVIRISGPDRLAWLHSLTTQHLSDLAPGRWTGVLVLSPQGHTEHAFFGYDDPDLPGSEAALSGTFLAWTEPGRGTALVEFLDRMRFMMRVEVELVTDRYAAMWRPAARKDDEPYSGHEIIAREQLEAYAKAVGPACGMWAYEALRIARGEPRFGLDTDERTIPNEAGWIGPAVHLDKGCYRGQETVARVHTLGRPPRRLVLLHLDGSENRLPESGAPLMLGDKQVGFVGTSARHFELGPIALGLLKRNVDTAAELLVDGMPVAQEVVVDPEVGLHVRPKLR